MNKRYWVVAALAATVACHDAAIGQQTKATRTAIGPYWSGYANGVQGQYSSAQAACDARAALINWGTLTYTALSDHKGNCVDSSGRAMGWSFFGQHCPQYYSMKNYVEYSNSWFVKDGISYGVYYGPNQYCESSALVVDRWHDKSQDQCTKFGNPIYPLSGAKQQAETLLSWSPFASVLSVTFDSRRKLPSSDVDPKAAFAPVAAPSFGSLWEGSMHKRLITQSAGNSGIGFFRIYHASRGAGNWVTFSRTSSSEGAKPDSDVNDRLVTLSSGWRYIDARSQAYEDYDSAGLLKSIALARGGRLLLSYSDSATAPSVAPAPGLLIKVEDSFGRAVQFGYELPEGTTTARVNRVVDPDGQVIQISYDESANLSRLTWPDNTVRQFLYEQSGLPWALTGILDENNERHSTYTYDQEGRAASTEYAGGANRYSLTYGVPPRWVTTETFDSRNQMLWRDHYWTVPQDVGVRAPNGTEIGLVASLIQGAPRVTTRSQPAGAGCDASTSSQSHDANGNVTSRTDFNGTKSCHAHDLSRNLETARVEGLVAGQDCGSVLPDGAPLPAGSRKVLTLWHPDWRVPVMVREPGRQTTYIYHGQSDPFNSGALAKCAPDGALLPDGKPIAVLCRTVEQATTDANGASGLTGISDGANAPADPFASQVVLHLRMDGASEGTSFPDASSRNYAPATVVSPVATDTGNAKVGTAAGRFTGGYLQYENSADWDLGSGDFTIEAWVKFNSQSPGSRAYVFGKASSTGGNSTLSVSKLTDNTLRVSWTTTGGTGTITDMAPVVPDAWYHLTVQRTGGTIDFRKNGQLVASAAISGSFIPNAHKFGVGIVGEYAYAYGGASGTRMMGWIDEFKITKGVGRYADPIDTAVPRRTWSRTYNEHGQVLTARDPLNNLTTYTYHPETTANYTKGDLKSVTNPALHTTQYTRYDKSGRLLESVDANGTKTETTYTPRGWVKTVTTTPPGAPAQTTVYDYDGVGQLKKATLSDGTVLEYTYDAAHRLRSIKDAAGNAVTYTLDNMGNRTGEELKDASGTLARNITRVYDALSRVQHVEGAMQ